MCLKLERLADNRRHGVGTTAVVTLCSSSHDTTSRQLLDAFEFFSSLIASGGVTENKRDQKLLVTV